MRRHYRYAAPLNRDDHKVQYEEKYRKPETRGRYRKIRVFIFKNKNTDIPSRVDIEIYEYFILKTKHPRTPGYNTVGRIVVHMLPFPEGAIRFSCCSTYVPRTNAAVTLYPTNVIMQSRCQKVESN